MAKDFYPHTKRTLKGQSRHTSLKCQLRRSMTPAEHKLWLKLKNRSFKNLKFRRQHGIGSYIVDFYCPQRQLVIEIDGDVHALPEQIIRDQKRESFLKSLGLTVIRYTNNDIFSNLDGVLQNLYNQT